MSAEFRGKRQARESDQTGLTGFLPLPSFMTLSKSLPRSLHFLNLKVMLINLPHNVVITVK